MHRICKKHKNDSKSVKQRFIFTGWERTFVLQMFRMATQHMRLKVDFLGGLVRTKPTGEGFLIRVHEDVSPRVGGDDGTVVAQTARHDSHAVLVVDVEETVVRNRGLLIEVTRRGGAEIRVLIVYERWCWVWCLRCFVSAGQKLGS